MTLLISATVHDVGHPGFNNAFMVAVETSQALIYNDQSVLENYHCSLTYQILQKDKNNILKNVSRDEKNMFRKILINNVLSTDLARHFPIINKFESAIDDLKLDDEQSRHMAMAVALKCGDVGHSAKALDLHKIWSRRVTEEFWNQGDHETDLGIPLTQLCDRKNNIAKSQDGFLNFLAIPLFEGFGKFLHKYISQDCFEKYSSVCLVQLKKNKEYWVSAISRGDSGNSDFIAETEANVRNIKLSPLPLDSLLNFPEYLHNE